VTLRCATLEPVTDAQPVRRERARPAAKAHPAAADRGPEAEATPSPEGDPATFLTHFAPPTGFTASELAEITGGLLLRRSSRFVRGAAVDSRLLQPGQLFVALPGERTDGHRFLGEAVRAGAAALLVSRRPTGRELDALGDVTVVQVDDGIAALGRLAARWRTAFSPFVVGVTGSIAKTSTKEAIAAVMGRHFTTLKNEGNLNNEIGLPLTLLRLGPEHEAAVLEMAMYAGGEIAQLAAMAQPRVGVVTAVLGVHLSRLGSIEAIERAKGELVEALPADGVAILNADDERVARMAGRTSARSMTYGFARSADVRAEDVQSLGPDGMRFTLRTPDATAPVATPALGRHAVHNALAAAAVGTTAGVGLDDIVAGLAGGWSAAHRAQPLRAGDVQIIDDSYNASPASVRAALELLGDFPGRHVAVLGEMRELGDETEAGHREVGAAAALAADLVMVVGSEAAGIAEGARSAGMPDERILAVDDRRAAVETLIERLQPGDVVLVKASRGVELDLLVDDLRAALAGAPA
jgi:UDP-N-acetylmuramoyl-tripeptide--D-alanyl-D-alanine ligase